MEKKVNRYKIVLEQTEAKAGAQLPTPVDITFDNHDNVFAIVEYLQQKDPFKNVREAAQFAIGLKMFSEVMIKNKSNPLFQEILPTYRTFMQKLKAL